MSEDTTLRYWYEVAVTWDEDNGTDTIAQFDSLEQAVKFMNDDKEIESELQPDMFEYVENVFIDKWLGDTIMPNYKDRKFNAIIRTINKPKTKAVITWYAEDIKSQCDTLTDKQIGDVLSLIENNHDATIGVNWEVINYYIEKVTKEGK
jgi:hypothetical protein